MTSIDSSQRVAAKVAGFMLLFLMAAGFFAQIYVPSEVVVAGDAATTADNVVTHEWLFRIGSATDVLIFAGDIVMAVAFYVLLKRVRPGLVMLGLLWRVAQATIMAVNALTFLAVPLIVHGTADLRGFTTEQRQALATVFVGLHTTGFGIGLVFLGLGNALFSYVLFRSGYIPRALAGWGVFANVVLAAFTLTVLIAPGTENAPVVAVGRYVPVFLFEVITGGWLLISGVRMPANAESPAVAKVPQT